MKVGELVEHLKANGEVIKEQIRARKYKPQPVRRVEIPKPDGGIRNLGVLTVTDRFIQQAIAQVLTPIYEEQLGESSYGFRPGRCAEMAIIKGLELMNEGYTWIVDMDLEKFFDNVNHDKLMNIISKTIKDRDVISLIRKFLVSGVMIDDEYRETIIGMINEEEPVIGSGYVDVPEFEEVKTQEEVIGSDVRETDYIDKTDVLIESVTVGMEIEPLIDFQEIGHDYSIDEVMEESDKIYESARQISISKNAERICNELQEEGLSYWYLTVSEKVNLFEFRVDDNHYNMALHTAVLKKLGVDMDFDERYKDYQKVYEVALEMQRKDREKDRGR